MNIVALSHCSKSRLPLHALDVPLGEDILFVRKLVERSGMVWRTGHLLARKLALNHIPLHKHNLTLSSKRIGWSVEAKIAFDLVLQLI